MRKIKDVMTPNVQVVTPEASLQDVAVKMKNQDIGAIPVCLNGRILGMVTDRDVVVRSLAEGKDPLFIKVQDVMSSPVVYCYEDQNVSEAAELMEEKQIRRLVVLDRNNHIVGITSLGDIAVRLRDDDLSGEVLEKISEPSSEMKVA